MVISFEDSCPNPSVKKRRQITPDGKQLPQAVYWFSLKRTTFCLIKVAKARKKMQICFVSTYKIPRSFLAIRVGDEIHSIKYSKAI